MANPGEVITVWEGNNGINWTGYREPAKACFKKPANLPAINQEEVDQAKPLLTKEVDVNGDGLLDQFRVVETKEYFLALLYRGANYMHVWESSCGGGASGGEKNYTEPEPHGQLLGAIAKKPNTKQNVTEIDWQENRRNKKENGRLVVSGLGVYGNFVSIPCPDLPKSADASFVGGCCCP